MSTSLPIVDRIPLKRRVLTASAWSLAGYTTSMGIRFGSNLIVTRLLVPQMFSVMAIATIVTVGLAMFSDLGLRQSIVQSRRGDDLPFLNTAWSLQILRGLVLWLMALAVAFGVHLADRAGLVPGDSVYTDPSLPDVIGIVSFGAVIAGFESTKLSEAGRHLAIGQITRIDIAAQISGLVCIFAWVSLDRSVWALVAGGLVTGLVRTTLSHVLLPGTANRWQWDRSAFVELIHFGKWIFASSILAFLAASSDRLLLGWMVDTSVLGVYVIAFLIFSSIEQLLMKVIAGVSFPALSEVARERRSDLNQIYYRLHVPIACIAYISSGFLLTSGQTLIRLLYDRRYASAGWMLEILATALIAVPFRTAGQYLMALGKPKLISVMAMIRVLVLFVFVPIGFRTADVHGAIWGVVLSYLSIIPLATFYKLRYGLFNIRAEGLVIALIFVGMAIGQIVDYSARH
jgi:O-antigen/teichoic acid export membrane protein